LARFTPELWISLGFKRLQVSEPSRAVRRSFLATRIGYLGPGEVL